MIEARESLPCSPKPPLVVKIAPDLTDKDKEDIAAVVLRNQVNLMGNVGYLQYSPMELFHIMCQSRMMAIK